MQLRNFVMGQGYDQGPVVVYPDNLSCMALLKRGGPAGSERSRHIHIEHFLVIECVTAGEAIVEHLGTDLMFANYLTKPVQGEQFIRERHGLTK
jgi:hypothetical protein